MQPQFITLPRTIQDLTGQRFGRLVVLGPRTYHKGKSATWYCQCDCGNTTETSRGSLMGGRTQSCGCLHREQLAERNKRHGLTDHYLYPRWGQMITRCTNPNSLSYANYGGRGITVCSTWVKSFEAFLNHVKNLSGYGKPGMTLDRIDNSENYEPGNVRWASRSTQRRNSRQNIEIAYRSKTQTLIEWAEELGISRGVLYQRLYVGWTVERAFSIPASTLPGGHDSRKYPKRILCSISNIP